MPRLIHITLIESEIKLGDGTKENPFRTIEEYHTTSGFIVARFNPTDQKVEFDYEVFHDLIRSTNP